MRDSVVAKAPALVWEVKKGRTGAPHLTRKQPWPYVNHYPLSPDRQGLGSHHDQDQAGTHRSGCRSCSTATNGSSAKPTRTPSLLSGRADMTVLRRERSPSNVASPRRLIPVSHSLAGVLRSCLRSSVLC